MSNDHSDPIAEVLAIREEWKRKKAEKERKKPCPMIVQDPIPEALAIREESKHKKDEKERNKPYQITDNYNLIVLVVY